jgi:hypothetical protein
MLSALLLSVIMVNVIMPSVVTPLCKVQICAVLLSIKVCKNYKHPRNVLLKALKTPLQTHKLMAKSVKKLTL